MFYIWIRFRLACVIAFPTIFTMPRNLGCCSIEMVLQHQVLQVLLWDVAKSNSRMTREATTFKMGWLGPYVKTNMGVA